MFKSSIEMVIEYSMCKASGTQVTIEFHEITIIMIELNNMKYVQFYHILRYIY